MHEARETYKTLKDQNIGNAATCAQLYADWAAMECSTGERERALSVLRKGIKAGAQPVRRAPTPRNHSPCHAPRHVTEGFWALIYSHWQG